MISRRRALGLRWRLTLTYAGLSALLLVGVGVLFRQTLKLILRANAEDMLDEEWGSLKGYLRLEKGQAVWLYDREDPEESAIVLKFRQGMFLLTDGGGKVIEASDSYKYVGLDRPEEIRDALRSARPVIRERVSEDGYAYLVRSGAHYDDFRKPYYVAVGHSLDSDRLVVSQFTRQYLSVAPVLILALSAVGWWAAGRALRPVDDVARAARELTGDNLGLRLSNRGANDELDHLIDSFNSMAERLEASFNQIRRFSIDVSHELRTPLTAIRGQLEVALMTGESREQYRDAMVSAMEDVDRLAKIVRTLLHLSQAESGQVNVAREPVDLGEMAADLTEQFQIPAEAQGLTLRAETGSGCVVAGDKLQLERLLSNLLSNAIKYTPAGGITVSAARDGDEVRLRVRDTGRGIPPEHLPHVFNRFYRVPDGSTDPDKGLGLGLSFVAWIAKAHNGRVEVESTPGQGTVFTVSLPAAAA